MRHAHYLPGNSRNETPHDAIWIDTETMACFVEPGVETHHLRFGYAAHRRRLKGGKWSAPDWLRFTTIDQLWDWVESKLHGRCKLYLFAHNWGFDFPVLDGFKQLRNRGYELLSAVIESPPVILRWRRPPHTLQVIDTLNIWRLPLAQLGEDIGLPKLDMPTGEATAEEWDAYGKRDVEIIMAACLQWWDFLQDNNLGGFANTLASQALRTFRHRFMEHGIFIDDNTKALALSRSAYFGGRTEAAYIGKVPFKVYRLDVNSMYPDKMAKHLFPVQLVGHYRRINRTELAKLITKYCVTARVTISTDVATYPLLTKSHLLFPVGEFTTSLSTPEIEYALLHGHIVEVHEVAVYEGAKVFAPFVNYMYEQRLAAAKRGADATANNFKKLMNSLYGKFGQRGRRYDITEHVDNDDIRTWLEIDAATGKIFNFRQYGGIVEQLFDEPEGRESHPAIAAHVTAYARMHHWSLMCMAGHGHYVYLDTDSLWVDYIGYLRLRHLKHQTELGMLKREGVNNDVVIHGVKDYRYGERVKIKGVRAKALEVASATYEQDKFSSLKGLLRTGNMSAPVVERQTKRLQRDYCKGVIGDDGWVRPLLFIADRAGCTGCRSALHHDRLTACRLGERNISACPLYRR